MLKVSTKGLKKLSKFPTVFNNSNLERKHLLVGSMFPQKFQFEENKVRTEDINPILLKITSINRKLHGNKKKDKSDNSDLSHEVLKAGIEPARLATLDFESNVSTNSTT